MFINTSIYLSFTLSHHTKDTCPNCGSSTYLPRACHWLQRLLHPKQHLCFCRQCRYQQEDYRELVIPFDKDGYIAAYRYAGDSLVVLGVRHQRELQPPPLL